MCVCVSNTHRGRDRKTEKQRETESQGRERERERPQGWGAEGASMASACAVRADLSTFPGETEYKILRHKRTSHMWTLGIQFTLFSTFFLTVSFELEGK